MDDVTLGPGNLAGRGVYAARDFAAGEVVVTFQLQPLDEADFLALPAGEDLFVHSFGGRRYRFPAPARFVNHSDDPSCYQDLDGCRNIALRPIATGEPITIDANGETAHELDTFLNAYQDALRERSAPLLAALVDSGTTLWVHGQVHRGRDPVVAALLQTALASLSEIEWHVGTGRWEALGSTGIDTADGRRHLTMLLKIVSGNWQIVYQHVG